LAPFDYSVGVRKASWKQGCGEDIDILKAKGQGTVNKHRQADKKEG
jgi:hypothetical protein